MIWSLSNQLLPGEEIIESPAQKNFIGISATYSALLTNMRVLFLFGSLGSNLTQSFFYDEILDVSSRKRLFVSYLCVKTKNKEYFINTADTETIAEKIMRMKEQMKETDQRELNSTEQERCILLDMLDILRKNAILTDEEYEEKVYLVNEREF